MKIYLKALLKCKLPVKINDRWLKPATMLRSLRFNTASTTYTNWWLNAYNWYNDSDKAMLSRSRVFLAYDGALSEHGHGRDTSEFLQYTIDRLDESIQFFGGVVPPRVEMEIAFDDPEKFPYQYVKWTTLIQLYKIHKHIRTHKTWIVISLIFLLIATI